MATFDVFKGLKKSEINRIIDAGVVRMVEAGQLLFRKGDIGHEMYIILTGTIEIIDEFETKRKVLADLGPGEIFGEMAMFERRERSAHALAKERSQIVVLSEDVLNKLLEKKIPRRFLANVIGALCHRLRITNNLYMRSKYAGNGPKPIKWLD